MNVEDVKREEWAGRWRQDFKIHHWAWLEYVPRSQKPESKADTPQWKRGMGTIWADAVRVLSSFCWLITYSPSLHCCCVDLHGSTHCHSLLAYLFGSFGPFLRVSLDVILQFLLDVVFFYSSLMSFGVSSNNCLVADSINSHHNATTSKRKLRLGIFTWSLFVLASFIVFHAMMWIVPTCVWAGCLTRSKNVAIDIVFNAYVHGQREGYF